MSLTERLTKLKNKVEEAEREEAKAQGKLQSLEEQLKKIHKCRSLAEAEKRLSKMKKELEEMKDQLGKEVEEIEEMLIGKSYFSEERNDNS